MTQRNRAPKDDRILPTTTGIKSGCDDWTLVFEDRARLAAPEEPFGPLALLPPARETTLRASIIVSCD